jgi:hypothetical protein
MVGQEIKSFKLSMCYCNCDISPFPSYSEDRRLHMSIRNSDCVMVHNAYFLFMTLSFC